jgi:sterol desaturase/sphingolipid hydroxylase (fatty acid hydroxylase superfamily)
MPLALAHAHPAQPFNSTYYAILATIIPVLYLALAVQGDTFGLLIRRYTRLAQQYENVSAAKLLKTLSPTERNQVIAEAAGILIALCLIWYAGAAEIVALLALYHQRASSTDALIVLWAASVLTLMVLTVPVAPIWRAMIDSDRQAAHAKAAALDAADPDESSSAPATDLAKGADGS